MVWVGGLAFRKNASTRGLRGRGSPSHSSSYHHDIRDVFFGDSKQSLFPVSDCPIVQNYKVAFRWVLNRAVPSDASRPMALSFFDSGHLTPTDGLFPPLVVFTVHDVIHGDGGPCKQNRCRFFNCITNGVVTNYKNLNRYGYRVAPTQTRFKNKESRNVKHSGFLFFPPPRILAFPFST